MPAVTFIPEPDLTFTPKSDPNTMSEPTWTSVYGEEERHTNDEILRDRDSFLEPEGLRRYKRKSSEWREGSTCRAGEPSSRLSRGNALCKGGLLPLEDYFRTPLGA